MMVWKRETALVMQNQYSYILNTHVCDVKMWREAEKMK